MKRYGQHCPVARAAEVLTESWTLLIIRECLRGSEKLSDIAQGVPAMTATLLATRLRTLQEAGVVEATAGAPRDPVYRLTAAGRELAPIVDDLGRWGRRWLPRPRYRDYDPAVLLLDISSEIQPSLLPVRPVSVHIAFADGPTPRQWWLVLSRAHTRLARDRPDVPVALRIECTTGALTDAWLGHVSWLQAVREDSIRLVGDRDTARTVLGWITTSRFATVPRGHRAAPVDQTAAR